MEIREINHFCYMSQSVAHRHFTQALILWMNKKIVLSYLPYAILYLLTLAFLEMESFKAKSQKWFLTLF